MTQEEIQGVKQAIQAALTEGATQIASQIAEQTGQAVSQAIQKFMQTTGASTVVGKSELGDIGDTEGMTKDQMSNSGILFLNAKRTYDEYQDLSLKHARNLDNIAVQALQNAVETANLTGKQAVKHADIAADRIWNIDEVSDLSAKSGVQADLIQAIASSVAAAVLSELKTTGVAK